MTENVCGGCGSEITSETQFCKECGRPVNSGRDALMGVKKEVKPVTKQPEGKSLAPSSIPGAVAVVLAVGFTIFVWVSHPFEFAHQHRTLTHTAIASGLAIIGAILLILSGKKQDSKVER